MTVQKLCLGCGQLRQMPAKSKYCSWYCYVSGNSDAPVQRLVHSLGGFRAVARYCGATERSVRAWYQQGIPSKHFPSLTKMANGKRVDFITEKSLTILSNKTRHDYQVARHAAAGEVWKPRKRAARTEVQRAVAEYAKLIETVEDQ
jgi:hypothetical protein